MSTTHIEQAVVSAVDMMIDLWVKHRIEGRRKGIDSRDDWQSAPEWAHLEADQWVREDAAWRLLVGIHLADAAIEQALS